MPDLRQIEGSAGAAGAIATGAMTTASAIGSIGATTATGASIGIGAALGPITLGVSALVTGVLAIFGLRKKPGQKVSAAKLQDAYAAASRDVQGKVIRGELDLATGERAMLEILDQAKREDLNRRNLGQPGEWGATALERIIAGHIEVARQAVKAREQASTSQAPSLASLAGFGASKPNLVMIGLAGLALLMLLFSRR